MDIIPFLYLLLLPVWMGIFFFLTKDAWVKLLLESINILITIHALYLIYSMWQWFIFLKPFLTTTTSINWNFIFSTPVIQTFGVCFLPLLFFIPSFQKNKYSSIFVYLFMGWCYAGKVNFYFFSFHKIALSISIFITVFALRWLLYARLKNS